MVLAGCQTIIQEEAEKERADLLEKLAELDALVGKPSFPEPNGERDGKARGPALPKYRSKKNPDVTWAGRGGVPRWLQAEMEESGEPREAFLIASETAE